MYSKDVIKSSAIATFLANRTNRSEISIIHIQPTKKSCYLNDHFPSNVYIKAVKMKQCFTAGQLEESSV